MVERVKWTSDLEIGINVIDSQHHRIVDYINALADMSERDYNKHELGELLDSLIDYTYSHFAFEEALMEEAGYEYLDIHQQTHQAFRDRVNEFYSFYHKGEDVIEQIGDLLKHWLIHHIMDDDQSYASVVREEMHHIENKYPGGWVNSAMRFFFK